MGDSITEGEVHQMLKSKILFRCETKLTPENLLSIAEVGDYVELDEVVCSVETDKTQVPIRSPEAGVITELFAAEGQSVEVGKPFFVIDTDAKKPEGAPAAAKSAVKATEAPVAAAATTVQSQQKSAPVTAAAAAVKPAAAS